VNRLQGASRRWGWIASGISATLLVLGGCATIPTSGPVQAGPAEAAPDEDVLPIPPEIPEYDAVGLVGGFLKASAAGVGGDYSDVRDYLYGDAVQDWDPTAHVTIYGAGDFTPVWDDQSLTVTYSFPVVATLDDQGRMTEAPSGTRTAVTFGVTSVLGSRWRISSLDDGIIISEANFRLVYRPVVLDFASRDGDVIVPDLRWLPRNNIATFATLALISGPSAWLDDAVETGFAPTASLEVVAVPLSDGRATVALASGSVVSAADRSLALEEITYTLEALPEVRDVVVTVGGLPIGGDGSVSLSEAPVPSLEAAAIVSGRIGVWAGDQVLVPALGGLVPTEAHDIALSYDGVTVAMLLGESEMVTATIPSGLVAIEDAGSTVSTLATTTVLEGTDLVSPSFDREGWVWTAEAQGQGALIAVAPGGDSVRLPIAGAEGRDIDAVAVSPDGARVAVLSREGGLWRLGVLGLVRAEDGTPTLAGEPLDIGVGIGESAAIEWVGGQVVAVLGVSEPGETPTLALVTVGGRTESIAAIPDAVALAARSGGSSIVLVTRDGSLYVRSSSGWARVDSTASFTSLAFSG